MKKPHITIKKAVESIGKRDTNKAILRFPYKVKYKNQSRRLKWSNKMPLRIILNALQLQNLKHSDLDDPPTPVDISTIVSCYLFGSAVQLRYKKEVKKYLWGLYVTEKEKRIKPNDIDIMCFLKGVHAERKINSITHCEKIIYGSYGNRVKKNYYGFDITFVPSQWANCYRENYDFITHIRENGVCLMGDNIINAEKYAIWEHEPIKDIITCCIPKYKNVATEEEIKELEKKIKPAEEKEPERFEILDIR